MKDSILTAELDYYHHSKYSELAKSSHEITLTIAVFKVSFVQKCKSFEHVLCGVWIVRKAVVQIPSECQIVFHGNLN